MNDKPTRVVRRPISGRRIKPLRQGDLDGLCGVYAIINAVRHLCPEIDREQARELFIAMLHARHRIGARRPLTFVYGGIGRREIVNLADAAIDHLANAVGVIIETDWRPTRKGQPSRLAAIWRWLAGNISPACVAIIALGGRTSHWTVVVEITRRQLRLLDSDGMRVVRRDQFAPRAGMQHYEIEHRCILLVRRARPAVGAAAAAPRAGAGSKR